MYDIIIIGGGPAGLTAALYALRAEKKVLVIEGTGFGGQIVYTKSVENFPGRENMNGAEFADELLAQVMNNGGEIAFEKAEKIENGKIKTVITDDGAHSAKAIIAATGVGHRHLNVRGEAELIGKGVSFCAVCDGAFYKGKTVCVVGGGNTAADDALYLSDIAEKVYLIHRRDSFRAEPKTITKLKGKSNIEMLLNTVVTGFTEKDGVLSGIETENVLTNVKSVLSDVSGAFLAVGQVPQNEIFRKTAELDENGYLVAGENTQTSASGIFAAGDCRTKAVRQLTTAVADGTVAAIAACEYINEYGA